VVFSSTVFVFVFLPLVLFFNYVLPKRYRNTFLLLASLFFYAWGEPVYVILLLFSSLINYRFGRLLDFVPETRRKTVLVAAISVNLLLLGVFKYAGFFAETFLRLAGSSRTPPSLPMPLGISFFTFHALSYILDIYRHKVSAQQRFPDFALYMSLFSQLIAGPIIRYADIFLQLRERETSIECFAYGVRRFVVGLFKKLFLANQLGAVADTVFGSSPAEHTIVDAWLGISAYTLQIYFDFSGYSDMALGLARMFGFTFMENFNYPYISTSIREFWRRWHISLSSWFRDYVYFSLGGSRGSSWETYRNIFIVWFLIGFWHGAGWAFIFWGVYYAVILMLERAWLGSVLTRLPRFLRHAYVILVVMIGFVFFRADDFGYSLSYLASLFGGNGCLLANSQSVLMLMDNWHLFILGAVFSTPIVPMVARKLEGVDRGILYPCVQACSFCILLLFTLMILVDTTFNPFIYFRF
jgi:alginate O-acetyltransferase complex protein AlgI